MNSLLKFQKLLIKGCKMKKRAIVLDIDGVLLDSSAVFQELFDKKLKGDEKWNYFQSNCNGSKVHFIQKSLEFVEALSTDVDILLLTARNEKCRKSTEFRLTEELFPWDEIYMRKDGDYREAPAVKKEQLQRILEDYEVIAFIDDDLSNCEIAKELGVFSLRKI